MVRRFSMRYTLFLFVSDLILVVVALLLATWVRMSVSLGLPAPTRHWVLPAPVYLLAVVLWALTFITLNLYDPKRSAHLISELQTVAAGTLAATLMLSGALYFSYRLVSRLQVLYFTAIYLALITLFRIILRLLFRNGRRMDSRRVLVVGTDEAALDVGSMIREYAWAGLQLVGYAGDAVSSGMLGGAPVVGELQDVLRLVEKWDISEVVITLPAQEQQAIRPLIYELQERPLNVRVMPDYFDLAFLQVRIEDFGGMPLITLKEPTLNPFQRMIKRGFDLFVTALLMIPALPLMLLIALGIKLDSRGPVFFPQERIGEGGHTFKMLKFRTMVEDAEARLKDVITHDAEGNIIHKVPDDPRVTGIGRFLRHTSLDELPQLFNVLRGEMSLVGPRPEMPWLVENYEPWQRKRFEVPQGMTGWWQINGRSDQPMHLYTEEDLFYIRNYSLWLDLQIIWRTIGVVLTGRGAY